jgi:hypothetical protein
LHFNILHAIVRQKMLLFMATAVRISNPTQYKLYSKHIQKWLGISDDKQLIFGNEKLTKYTHTIILVQWLLLHYTLCLDCNNITNGHEPFSSHL